MKNKMKILVNENVFGWIMTGLLGKDAKWFLGYSKNPNKVDENTIEKTGDWNITLRDKWS